MNCCLTFFLPVSYWKIPQNNSSKRLLLVLKRIDRHCWDNELRLLLQRPPPSICQRALLPAEFWAIFEWHTPSSTSPSRLHSRQLHEPPPLPSHQPPNELNGAALKALWCPREGPKCTGFISAALTGTIDPDINISSWMKNATILRNQLGFLNVYCVDGAVAIKTKNADAPPAAEAFSCVNISVSLAGLLRLWRWNWLLPGSVVSRRRSPPAREFLHPSFYQQARKQIASIMQLSNFITLLPSLLLPLRASSCWNSLGERSRFSEVPQSFTQSSF